MLKTTTTCAPPVRYALGDSSLGLLLVATRCLSHAQTLCAVIPGDDQQSLLDNLALWFGDHEYIVGDAITRAMLNKVICLARGETATESLPVSLQGTTFQRQVWRALMSIPSGSTRSYGQLARQLGKPRGARAVASACAANRLAVVVPCHRVVAANGNLSGYRWGQQRKRQLLEWEARTIPKVC